MLESRDLGGKCADLNALYVGLARAAGLPARDVYGIRVAKSELGYKSLGASSENVTKAQHCRAEVYLGGYGWVPVDPADVRKVVLEEPPGNRPLDDDMVKKARARLFGSWEMNWMAYNFAHDVALPGSSGAPVGFLMYPQAETADGRLDSLDPDSFKYEITSQGDFACERLTETDTNLPSSRLEQASNNRPCSRPGVCNLLAQETDALKYSTNIGQLRPPACPKISAVQVGNCIKLHG